LQTTDLETLGRRSSFPTLKQVLGADAGICIATGLLSFGGARWLAPALDLPTALLAGSGAILIAYAAGLLMLVTRRRIPGHGVRTVTWINLGWAAGCLVLLFSGWFNPNALGVGFIMVQIVAVLVFADLQVMALRAVR